MIVDKTCIRALFAAVNQLPELMKNYSWVDEDKMWQSYYIDAEEPIVERIWRPIDFNEGNQKWRVCLHRIQPSDKAFYHPHRHPSAVLVCEGSYEMGVGYGEPDSDPPPIFGPIFLKTWDFYQMGHPFNWHYIKTVKAPSFSIMVTGEPYNKDRKIVRPKPRSLNAEEIIRILNFFSPGIIATAKLKLREGLEKDTTVVLGNN